MAIVQNLYTGNGSTVLFPFSFPYLDADHIFVSLDGTLTTAFTLPNANTVEFNVAPAAGVAIRIFRETPLDQPESVIFAGSAIRASDLNKNNTQLLYVSQETSFNTETANTTANGIAGTANTALSNSNAAVATANTASSNATTATSTANTALSTANTASTNASTALSTANTALSTANTASSNATTAVSTASAAVTTANAADVKADQALASVLTVTPFVVVANVAAIPASPTNGSVIEVTNSTGIQSFTPLTGLPVGFIGDAGLSVRLLYTSAGTTWNWQSYFPNNSEIRYAKIASPTLTGIPAAPTPAVDTNTTQLATTAYVVGQNYTKQTRTISVGAGLTGGGDLSANRSIAADIATQVEAEAGSSSTKLMTPQRVAQAMLKLPLGTVFVVGVSTVLATPTTNRPRVVVIASGLTLDLPVSPTIGSEVSVTIAGNFTNTIIARNGQNIMSLAEDLTIDRANVTVTLLYVDATRGWRIV
jgi:hypothetical protein